MLVGVTTDVEPLVRMKWDEGMADDPGVRDVVRQLDLACRHMGFFYVVCNSANAVFFSVFLSNHLSLR